MCTLRWRSGGGDNSKVSFVLVFLMAPVITLPCISALVAASFMIFGSFSSIAVLNCVTGRPCLFQSLQPEDGLVHRADKTPKWRFLSTTS